MRKDPGRNLKATGLDGWKFYAKFSKEILVSAPRGNLRPLHGEVLVSLPKGNLRPAYREVLVSFPKGNLGPLHREALVSCPQTKPESTP